MSETTETATHGVLLTDVAAAKVRSLLEQEGRDDLRLRVAVQPGGCSGLIYQLYFDERVLDGDALKDYDGVEVVVDRMSVPVPRRRDDRLRRHDREAGLHDRQPERRQRVRVRRLVQLTPVEATSTEGPAPHAGPGLRACGAGVRAAPSGARAPRSAATATTTARPAGVSDVLGLRRPSTTVCPRIRAHAGHVERAPRGRSRAR